MTPNNAKSVLDKHLHKRVQDFIELNVGIQLPEHKRSLVESRLVKRQRLLGLDTLESYVDFALTENSEEQIHMIDALTTNKTQFFREDEHFDFLQAHITADKSYKNKDLKVWCAGCSTGEEAYSLAIILTELVNQQLLKDFQIHATDISITCLQLAKNAVYSQHQIAPISESRRKKFILRGIKDSKGRYRIIDALRKKVTFSEFNLMQPRFHINTHYDVIMCRNVMIYFSSEQRTHLIEQFWHQLSEKGLFFVGHSEGIANLRNRFVQLIAAAYQKGKGK